MVVDADGRREAEPRSLGVDRPDGPLDRRLEVEVGEQIPPPFLVDPVGTCPVHGDVLRRPLERRVAPEQLRVEREEGVDDPPRIDVPAFGHPLDDRTADRNFAGVEVGVGSHAVPIHTEGSSFLGGERSCETAPYDRYAPDTAGNPPMTKLRADELRYAVDGETILDGVSLAVDAGETVAVVGPSGAGKSSFLRLLDRLDEPTGGTVYLDGTDYRSLDPETLRKRVGLVPQQPALREGTVVENVTIGPRLRGESVGDERVAELLVDVGLAGYADRDVSDLSGGEAQRVAIARTVVNDPDVLLLDEPTASLDSEAEAAIERLLTDLLATGERTAILVTHDERQAARLADRVARFADGRIVDVGVPREVIA